MIQVQVHHRDVETGELRHVANVAYRGTRDDQRSPFDQTAAGVERALDHAWRRTNNVDGSWSRGFFLAEGVPNGDFSSDVEVLVGLPVHEGRTYGLRSSMVGDIFVADGEVYRVASFGFDRLPELPA